MAAQGPAPRTSAPIGGLGVDREGQNSANENEAADDEALGVVCELGDMRADGEIEWFDPDDASCEGDNWLLLGEDAPSVMCAKHAALLKVRLSEEELAGTRLVRA